MDRRTLLRTLAATAALGLPKAVIGSPVASGNGCVLPKSEWVRFSLSEKDRREIAAILSGKWNKNA